MTTLGDIAALMVQVRNRKGNESMRRRGILRKVMLKSCASDEQRLLVENTTLLLRLSHEGVKEPEHLLLDPHDRRGLQCSACKAYCSDKGTSHWSAFLPMQRTREPVSSGTISKVGALQYSTVQYSTYQGIYLMVHNICLIDTAVIDVAIDAAIDPDRPASANNFNDGATIDRP
ncbi:hypothetical protein FGSG_13580 [Fusarium graminearum PH-1]|uniref:Chromosome 4, complete genome n=1 Tax=Gibberella zeae (strain ATCC MYA-4620 / CBS 123657 / FGSC 9075 / NRRL 31084 / PH-1) TaxID=229533 RepID=I1S9P9_GIBZE|nr:hypothetical protein FGSG_13580 [Fusarium graminearum PH-1]ESU16019.1 hypothetical protein FGSG_13580 [Fusarium graminearum PH-1]CEF83658.1 unnamed protein product [Fusarium graminearum]|eukprot:XP_011328297.1 hypothetical protein FGSG_13580 [Fusarium graminearum PH-1]